MYICAELETSLEGIILLASARRISSASSNQGVGSEPGASTDILSLLNKNIGKPGRGRPWHALSLSVGPAKRLGDEQIYRHTADTPITLVFRQPMNYSNYPLTSATSTWIFVGFQWTQFHFLRSDIRPSRRRHQVSSSVAGSHRVRKPALSRARGLSRTWKALSSVYPCLR
jgi:hypothetical protein